MTNRKQGSGSTRDGPCPRLWALLAAVVLASATSAASPPDSLGAFRGHWQRIGADPEQERLTAIEAAIEDLSWVMRGVAGPVLRRATVPSDQYVFEFDAAGFRMGSHGRAPSPLRLDGSERVVDGDRGRVEVGSEQLANGIRTTWRTEQAHGSNTFELQDGGQQLVVRSTLVVTAISGVDPIAYVERFARTAEAPARQPTTGND